MNEHTQSGIYDLAQTPSGEITRPSLIFLKDFCTNRLLSEKLITCTEHLNSNTTPDFYGDRSEGARQGKTLVKD